ncbi:MAG: hypothetical protein ACOYKM_12585 [Caulobacterales bacterium]|jgi:hypothetical protein
MEELLWLIQPIHVLLSGGTLAQAWETDGAKQMALLLAFAVPSTVIALGIGNTGLRETPLGAWFGFGEREAQPGTESDWVRRARDLDKDGTPDI